MKLRHDNPILVSLDLLRSRPNDWVEIDSCDLPYDAAKKAGNLRKALPFFESQHRMVIEIKSSGNKIFARHILPL